MQVNGSMLMGGGIDGEQVKSEDKSEGNEIYIPSINLPEVDIVADRPDYMRGLTAYDWSRANSPYYMNNLSERARFLRDVGTKRLTGQSDFMNGVNRLAAIPIAAVGAIGAIPAAAGLIAATTNPLVDAILTAQGLISAPKNIKQGIKNIKEGNILEGVFDLGSTALDVLGIGQLATRGSRMLHRGYRAKHAYNAIQPASYDHPVQRGKAWLHDMWYNNPVDVREPAWYKDLKRAGDYDTVDGYTRTGSYITPGTENSGKIADEARLDAWAIYNGLEPQYGTYIKNADGTYSYDMEAIMRKSNGTWKPLWNPESVRVGKHGSHGHDFVTGAGGGLSDFQEYLLPDNNTLLHIEDPWDLHPFSRKDDLISKRLNKRLEEKYIERQKKAQEFRRFMYDRGIWGQDGIIKYGPIDKFLNKYRSAPYKKPKILDTKLMQKIDEAGSKFEAGWLLGGKPFVMKTDIPTYYREIPTIELLERQKYSQTRIPLSELTYGFNPDFLNPTIREYLLPWNSNTIRKVQ